MTFSISPLGKTAPVEPEAPKIFSESFRHTIVSSSYQPERSMLSMVDGAPRIAQYFRCFSGADEERQPFNPSGVGTYQSYTKIDNVPLKIEGAGSFSFDPEKAESEVTYSAWIIADVNPGLHDVLILDIGDGNAGLCAIHEQPEIRNQTANKVYLIQFKILCILTKQLFETLESRVVGTPSVYSKDSALHGGHSVITKGEESVGNELFKWGMTISNYIMRTFWWSPEKTIVYEREKNKVYDPYLVNFLCAVIPPEARTTYPQINQFSVQYGGLEKSRFGDINVWEFLLRCDMNLLQICDNKAAIIGTERLQNSRLYGNLRSSKIRYFLTTHPEDFLNYKVFYNTDGYPIVRKGTQENITYLFSEGFYKGSPEGEFENLVYSSYKDNAIDHRRLLAYCNDYFKLDEVTRLYHGAILLRLLGFARKIGGPL